MGRGDNRGAAPGDSGTHLEPLLSVMMAAAPPTFKPGAARRQPPIGRLRAANRQSPADTSRRRGLGRGEAEGRRRAVPSRQAARRQHGGPVALRRFPGGFPAALREPARLGAAA